MATFSQADIEAILDSVIDWMLKRQVNFSNQDEPVQIPIAFVIGVFEPDLIVNDDCRPADNIFTVGQEIIYRNVDAFCKHIEDAATSKGAVMVRDNLPTCLRS